MYQYAQPESVVSNSSSNSPNVITGLLDLNELPVDEDLLQPNSRPGNMHNNSQHNHQNDEIHQTSRAGREWGTEGESHSWVDLRLGLPGERVPQKPEGINLQKHLRKHSNCQTRETPVRAKEKKNQLAATTEGLDQRQTEANEKARAVSRPEKK